MISKTTLERLRTFNIPGIVDALLNDTGQGMSFEDRLTILVDYEHTRRLNARIDRLLKQAKLPSSASIEEVDFNVQRSLNKGAFLDLLQGQWINSGTNIIITGPTGVGKSFLASVLTRSLCLNGYQARYMRLHHWLAEFLLLEEQRRFTKAVTALHKIPLLVFDEWLRDPVSQTDARLLLDLFDDRYKRLSCLFVSQIPVSDWHARFKDPTLADAILDRIVHNSTRFTLSGDSLRKDQERKYTSLRSDN